MVVRIVEAPHFEAESRALGAKSENIKAGRSLVGAALESRIHLVEVEIIRATTKDKNYRSWMRIKGKKSFIRVAIERYKQEDDLIVLLHAVIPAMTALKKSSKNSGRSTAAKYRAGFY